MSNLSSSKDGIEHGPILKRGLGLSENVFFILDGNNNVFRNYIGFIDCGLRNPGVYGTLRFLLNTYQCFHPKKNIYVVCWDKGRNPDRVLIDPGYKIEDRLKKKEEDLHRIEDMLSDCRILEKVLLKLGVHQAVGLVEQYEGDDLIASLAHDAQNSDEWKCVIISDDKDFLQLFSNLKINWYSPRRKALVSDKDSASSLLGFNVDGFLLYKSLCGDASDCIRGVGGIGHVIASGVATDYTTVDNFISAPDHELLSRKFGKRLLEARTNPALRTNEELIRLRRIPYTILDGCVDIDGANRILFEHGLSFLRPYFERWLR